MPGLRHSPRDASVAARKSGRRVSVQRPVRPFVAILRLAERAFYVQTFSKSPARADRASGLGLDGFCDFVRVWCRAKSSGPLAELAAPMNLYRIIGGDGKEYGPISSDQLRQWLAEN